MQVLYPCCCGLDIHKRFVVACVLTTARRRQRAEGDAHLQHDDAGLAGLLDWLHGGRAARMSPWRAPAATGARSTTCWRASSPSWWRNAYHIKAVPGRKTDVKDAEWIADLLRHGLMRASFIPAPAQRHLRDLTRYRTHLVEERARLTNRLQAVLEDANVKLASVVTDVRGVSARAILEALVAGRDRSAAAGRAGARAAARQARPARAGGRRALRRPPRLHDRRAPEPPRLPRGGDGAGQCTRSPSGCGGARRRSTCWTRSRASAGARPRSSSPRSAPTSAASPSAKHLASWAGMCPGNAESGGKRLSGRTRKGNRWLRQVLIEIAHVASKTKDTYLAAQYRRIAARRGKKRALVALGHTILVIVYHILTRREPYRDLGPAHFDELDRQRVEQRRCAAWNASAMRCA